MFESKTRSIIIPQYEHGRMAGTLASLWGNENFEKPEIDFDAFVNGVTLHDWHYGRVDNLSIGGASESAWAALVQRGVDYCFDDPVTDIVVKKHIRRLLSGHTSAQAEKLKEGIENRIAERLGETSFSPDAFAWADKITAFCDMVAFDFAFEEPLKRKISVYLKQGNSTEVEIEYEIVGNSEIVVFPWPFSVESVHGIVVGYEAEKYPDVLVPKPVTFTIRSNCSLI